MKKVDILQGTLDMLVLKTLSRGTMHGYEVSKWIRETTNEALLVEEDLCIRRFIAWKNAAGSSPNGEPPKTTERLNITRLPKQVAGSSK
jgi:hypothetical protein